MWKSSHRNAPEGVRVASPKTYPADLACDGVITVDQVNTAVGAEMKFDQYAVDSPQQEGVTDKCAWVAVDSEHDRTAARLSIVEWYGGFSSPDQDEFQFNGNDARREEIGYGCHITVTINADTAIETRASNDHGNSCELSESLMKIAFDKLPDA